MRRLRHSPPYAGVVSERDTYLAAASAFVDQVRRLPAEAYEGPGLGDWDLRALVGHASRSLVTVLTYLDQPAEEDTVRSAADYYVAIGGADIEVGDVTARGVAAGAAMGEDPVGFVSGLLADVTSKLAAYDDDYLLTTIAGGMRLQAYFPTRTFELVVHGLDIARATGVPIDLPDHAVAEAVALAGNVAARTGRGPDLLLAVTGRQPLPDGFSVV
jgi:uncharacterized protein (TIGR03083 family)